MGDRDRRNSRPVRKTLSECWQEFLIDVEARKLHHSTVRKYKLLRRQMEEYAEHIALRFIDEFELSGVSMFRATWKDGPRSSAKKLERMRAFFKFAEQRDWIRKNPAAKLKAPKVTLCPTLPFSSEEVRQILVATDEYVGEMHCHGVENGRRIRG
jgi:site-specific recombinase XerD